MTYRIDGDGESITCLICGRTSYNVNDIYQRYCVSCHVFHNDQFTRVMYKRVRQRLPEPGGELLSLECGHELHCIGTTARNVMPCSECVRAYLDAGGVKR